jgi:hypothetical protein
VRKGTNKAIGKKRRVAQRLVPGAAIERSVDEHKTHLTINELAREWGVNRATMYRVHLPKLPTVKFGGKRLIARSVADDYWASCQQAPGALRGGRPEQRAAGAP